MGGDGGEEDEKAILSQLLVTFLFVPTGLSVSLCHILRHLTLQML